MWLRYMALMAEEEEADKVSVSFSSSSFCLV